MLLSCFDFSLLTPVFSDFSLLIFAPQKLLPSDFFSKKGTSSNLASGDGEIWTRVHFSNVVAGQCETTTLTAMTELLYLSGRISSADEN